MNQQSGTTGQGQRSAIFGGDTQPRYSFPKANIADQVGNWDKFVVVGIQGGKPQIVTSESDDRACADLLKTAMPLLTSQHA